MNESFLARLNSATKYPSIETYHTLVKGILTEPTQTFPGEVVLTEKVDGTNTRIIVMPDGDYYIGSREELFHAKGDRVWNTALSIVDTLKDRAEGGLAAAGPGFIRTYYLEVFGGGIGGEYKNYTTGRDSTDYRLFDVSLVPVEVLDMEREQIASWRDHGGQMWSEEHQLTDISIVESIPLVPRIGYMSGKDLPDLIDTTYSWLGKMLPETAVKIDDTGRGKGEGIVIRSVDRVLIAKARFQDYERTMRKLGINQR